MGLLVANCDSDLFCNTVSVLGCCLAFFLPFVGLLNLKLTQRAEVLIKPDPEIAGHATREAPFVHQTTTLLGFANHLVHCR